jgi:hypothetical protein
MPIPVPVSKQNPTQGNEIQDEVYEGRNHDGHSITAGCRKTGILDRHDYNTALSAPLCVKQRKIHAREGGLHGDEKQPEFPKIFISPIRGRHYGQVPDMQILFLEGTN